MREGHEGDVDIQDVRKPVFQTLLYFTYTDQLPEVILNSCYAAFSCHTCPTLLACLHWSGVVPPSASPVRSEVQRNRVTR